MGNKSTYVVSPEFPLGFSAAYTGGCATILPLGQEGLSIEGGGGETIPAQITVAGGGAGICNDTYQLMGLWLATGRMYWQKNAGAYERRLYPITGGWHILAVWNDPEGPTQVVEYTNATAGESELPPKETWSTFNFENCSPEPPPTLTY